MMSSFLSRLALALAALIVAGIVALAGFGFLLFAAFLALRDIYPPAQAAALTGLGAFVLGGLIVLAARPRRDRRPPPKDLLATILSLIDSNLDVDRSAELGAMIGQQAANWIRGKPLATSVVAAAIGFLLGACPSLRRALAELIKPAE